MNEQPSGWTTIQQSRALVEAGLDPDTADMRIYLKDENDESAFEVIASPYRDRMRTFPYDHYLPCWSLGRLFDLIPTDIGDASLYLHGYNDGYGLRYENGDGVSQGKESGEDLTEIACKTICWLLATGVLKPTNGKDNAKSPEGGVYLTPRQGDEREDVATEDGRRGLLLTDLCMRLPYNVIVRDACGRDSVLTLGHTDLIDLYYEDVSGFGGDIKPYLRPIKSMTDEEVYEFVKLQIDEDIIGVSNIRRYNEYMKLVVEDLFKKTAITIWYDTMLSAKTMVRLLKKHFDWRGLIPMGLALPAPEGMYDNIEKGE